MKKGIKKKVTRKPTQTTSLSIPLLYIKETIMMKTQNVLFLVVVGLLALATVALASPERTFFSGKAVRMILDSKHSSSEWKFIHRSHPNNAISLVFAVKQRNVDMLDDLLMQVSDPTSPRYGQHLSFEQVGEIFRDDDAVNTVESWLSANGVTYETTPNGEFITASLSVAQAEKLLGEDVTMFHAFVSAQTQNTIHRTAEFSLPTEVAAAVDFVEHTVQFPSALPPTITTKAIPGSAATGNVDPALLQKFYNIPNDVSGAVQGNNMAVFEALGQNYNPTDLAAFQKQFNLHTTPISKVVGPNTPFICVLQPNSCVEATLDVEYMLAIAQGVPTWFWSIKGTDQTPFVDWAVAVAGTSDAPWVHSISYGGVENTEDPVNANRFNTEIGKLGLRGISVFIASGDDGVANFPARQDPTKCGFFPSFPATSPYVTAVGATQGPEDGKTEIACTSATGGGITTGGGFSDYFPQPSYQADAVSAYLKSGVKLPPSGQFNATGRAYPDVAMMGHNYEIVINGQTFTGSGTSASTPVFAGVVALVNGQRLASGKPTLGFLNPALYKAAVDQPSIFNDVTSGENNCAAGPNPDCCTYGFTAAKGFDPLTGHGSVKFDQFSKYFAAL